MTKHKLFEVEFNFYKAGVCGGDTELTTIALDAAHAIQQAKNITQERFETVLDKFEVANVKYAGCLCLSDDLSVLKTNKK